MATVQVDNKHVGVQQKDYKGWKVTDVKPGLENRAHRWQRAENKDLCERDSDSNIATEEVWRLSHVLGSLFSGEHLDGLSVQTHKTRADIHPHWQEVCVAAAP